MKIVFLMSLVYLSLICVVYYSKKKIKTRENQIYSSILIVNLFGVAYDLFQLYAPGMGFSTNYLIVFNKVFLVYVITWTFIFLLYVLNIGSEVKKLNKYLLLWIISVLTVLILPSNYNIDISGTPIVSGPAVIFDFVVVSLIIVYMLIVVINRFIHKKNYRSSKYIPLFVFLVLGTLATLIQYFFPKYLLTSPVEAFITILIFFFLENPDIQMMEELSKNKKLMQKSNEDTSNFLFRMTQDIKKPVKDIIEISNEIKENKKIDDIKENNNLINNKAKELDYLINDALDVSSMSTKTIKIYDTRYNVKNLFNEVRYQTESKISDKVKFEYSISSNIPEYLYGDSIKLKQILSSIIENSLKNTKEGYISLDIDSIIKYDICRLVINISDSGKGMNIEEINDILSLNIEDLSKINLSSEKKGFNLKEIKKLTMILGGNLIVKSGEGKGTTVSITIDQKIVENQNIELSKKLELYEQSLHRNKKIMVVDDDAKELAKITSHLEKQDSSVNGSLFGRDIIERISNKYKYDLIILDDETDTYSAYEVLKELKKNPKFKTPVVIMIDDSKEFIKLHYLKDGFADVIMKSKLKSELDRILKRF